MPDYPDLPPHPGKASLRIALHARRREITPGEREEWSAEIRRRLTASDLWQNARTVMLFAALRYEPDLMPLIEFARGRRLVFPALEEDRIVPRTARTAADFEVSPGGIREPAPGRCQEVPAEEIDLILVPGLAFSLDGVRLGRGRGHYDRFLTTLPASTIRCGVCFACQVFASVPSELHDVPMTMLLTEEGIRTVGGARADGAEDWAP